MTFLGAEETQRMKTASSNVTSAAAGAKPVVIMDRHTSETAATSVTRAASGIHHKTGASASAQAQTPGSLFQRPIRPTQVEPSGPDLLSSSSAAKQSKHKQQLQPQQQHASYRPPMHNMSQARRLSLIVFVV